MFEMIVIDNDTQDIYVNGRKWEKSPESYMHLRENHVHTKATVIRQLEVNELSAIKMYRAVQAM